MKWTAIVLTCANKNSSLAYQTELELKKRKNLIDKETLIMCIEDPEKPIGSGGATLNALLIVSEALSAKSRLHLTSVDVLKNSFILIIHMGRQYPFDLVSKGFCTLPLKDPENCQLKSNFDLLFNTMTFQIANFENARFNSDPGIYVCSSDMIFYLPDHEKIQINDKKICVVSSMALPSEVKSNGIYHLNNDGTLVENIYYQPDDEKLLKSSSIRGKFNLVSGIVYFNFEICKILFNMIAFPPLDACSYIGIDSGASPVSLSLFFDILLACCDGITREEYVNGQFKTNLPAFSNRATVLKQCRKTLWKSLHDIKIHNVTVGENILHVYMDNETFGHKKIIFDAFQYSDKANKDKTNSTNYINCLTKASNISSTFNSCQSLFVNSIVTKSELNVESPFYLFNCDFKSSKIKINQNTYLSDLKLFNEIRNFPSNLIIQNVNISLECLSIDVNLNVVFGMDDNLNKEYGSNDWTIMNNKMSQFSSLTSIYVKDLWPDETDCRTLYNAKLYPILNSNLNNEEMDYLRKYFWIDLANSCFVCENLVKKWKKSYRYSLEDMSPLLNLQELFYRRRSISNKINIEYLTKNVVNNQPIRFNSVIKNSIQDGFALDILAKFDEIALNNSNDLMILPRIMIFISNTLCEMGHNFSTIRSGPSLNINWTNAFQFIENGKIEEALIELSKERKNWLNRDDLLIRASRHYEGAMLAFIRLATTSFKNGSSRIELGSVERKARENEWIKASCPARLDLAGAWSDTPPITYECQNGSCVTNLAILVNNEKPIGAKGRIVNSQINKSYFIRIIMQDSAQCSDEMSKVSFNFSELEDFKDYNKPQAVACLMKAVCVFTKLIEFNEQNLGEQLKKKLNGSLELCTWTGLPQGSGLGTSSILIACVLKVIWYVMGIQVSNETLIYSVLLVEQLMTTNGGWQDQIGGVWGGFKISTTKNKLPLEICVKTIKINDKFAELINQRLILIYTGITRLAKDLLLNVLRNWYAISSVIYDNVNDLVRNGFKCCESIEKENLQELGECINKHRKQKLVMAPGSEPESVVYLIELLNSYVYGIALAGAGGGGFLYAITKEPDYRDKMKEKIESLNIDMKVYDAKISHDGIEIEFC